MSLGERINEIRHEQGLSIDQLVELSGIPKGTLSKITAGITTSPTLDTVKAIARALNCRLDDLDDDPRPVRNVQYSSAALKLAKKYDRLDEHGQKVVNIVADEETERMQREEERETIIHLNHSLYKASAGTGFPLDDGDMEQWTVVYNELTRRADFCVDISGRSMEPLYEDGDIVLVKSQPAVTNGQIGIYIKDGKGYIKKQRDGIIESVNPEYDDIAPEEFADIRCAGLVIGKLDKGWIR